MDPYANRGAEGPPYSQPPPMAPMGPPPTGRKRALLCACNYFNTRHQLGGRTQPSDPTHEPHPNLNPEPHPVLTTRSP